MRDIDEGRVQRAVLLLELDSRLHSELGVQVRKWLVEQERLRLAHDGSAQRHALALTA